MVYSWESETIFTKHFMGFWIHLWFTAQKMEFFVTDFSSKCHQILRKLRIWSHLLKKFVIETFIFCAVILFLISNNFVNFRFVFIKNIDKKEVMTGFEIWNTRIFLLWYKRLPLLSATLQEAPHLKGTLLQIWKSLYVFLFI